MEKSPDFKITHREKLKDIPSASGVDFLKNKFYVISDDSPWLFIFDTNLVALKSISIWDSSKMENLRIIKSLKPDFEAITSIQSDEDTLQLIFGSGSGELRKNLIAYNAHSGIVSSFSLENFYNQIIAKSGIKINELNIEAAASDGQFLYLFNRGNNFLVRVLLKEFRRLISSDKNSVSGIEIFRYSLPVIDGVPSGFSGACFTHDFSKIIFTASAEKTSDWFNDGEVIGSLIGILELKNIKKTEPKTTLIEENGNLLKLKIESVVIKKVEENSYLVTLVSDNDLGSSEIIEGSLIIE